MPTSKPRPLPSAEPVVPPALALTARERQVIARLRTPIAVQLRFLQTMREVASERNTTTFFPVPVDLLSSLRTVLGTGDGQGAAKS